MIAFECNKLAGDERGKPLTPEREDLLLHATESPGRPGEGFWAKEFADIGAEGSILLISMTGRDSTTPTEPE